MIRAKASVTLVSMAVEQRREGNPSIPITTDDTPHSKLFNIAMNNTPFHEPASTPRRSTGIITPPSIDDSSSPPFPHGTFSSPNDRYSSGEDSEELDIKNVSAFDEWDGDDTVGDDQDRSLNQRYMEDIYRVLSFDEIVYNDDGSDDQYQDELMWSISLSSRCHKSLQALFPPYRSSKDEQSLTSTQATKVISNKMPEVMLPNIRRLSLSPASDTITGATVEGSTFTKSSDKSGESNGSTSSWISLWCCGLSQSYSDDSLEGIQRRLFASSVPAPPIPKYVVTKREICVSSDHLLQHLETNDDKSTSITVFEDDDSFWNM